MTVALPSYPIKLNVNDLNIILEALASHRRTLKAWLEQVYHGTPKDLQERADEIHELHDRILEAVKDFEDPKRTDDYADRARCPICKNLV